MYPDSSYKSNFETDDTVYWFSHPFDTLNNWSPHAVKIWGKRFPTVEHAYHYRKFSDNHPKIAGEIFNSPSPWGTWQISREHKAKRQADWDDVKVDIMTELNRAKFAQNEDARKCLLATGKKKIVENSPWDSFWGLGPQRNGQNMMGKILMQIRDEIKKS